MVAVADLASQAASASAVVAIADVAAVAAEAKLEADAVATSRAETHSGFITTQRNPCSSCGGVSSAG